MNYEETLAYIHAVSWTGSRPGLERITALLHRLGDVQNRLRFVHVAGTNGKGSFCAMLASVLQRANYRVGLYTSPYVRCFNERMMINGEMIDNRELAALTSEIRRYADAMDDPPTEFELITAIAFLYFARHECDIVVLEAGMGGRLDATNVISTPVLSVITGVALDHTAFLGDTIAKIAAEKAGILRPEVPVLFGGKDREAHAVIAARAAQCHAPFYCTDDTALTVTSYTPNRTVFHFGSHQNLCIGLLGSFQPHNAATVITAVEILRSQGFSITEDALREGLLKTVWHARFEVICPAPLTIFDGSHNPEGVTAAIESIQQYFPSQRVIILTGVMRDKDYAFIASHIATVAAHVFTVAPNNARALPAADYAQVFRALGIAADAMTDLPAALHAAMDMARRDGKALVIMGSLYMYEEVMNTLENGEMHKSASYHL